MSQRQKIRVLVTDDSAFMRNILGDIISSAPDIIVAGRARSGADALQKIAELKPDVVTMDVEMPEMDGLQALNRIMEENPTPVIMISSQTDRDAEITIRCLESGAFDFIKKPSGPDPDEMERLRQELLQKIRLAFTSNTSVAARRAVPEKPVREYAIAEPPVRGTYDLLLIAASTGGPQTLARLMPKIPSDFPAPIALVQHMPREFTRSFAQRLDQISGLSVTEAKDNVRLLPGMAIVAPGGSHLLLRGEKGNIRSALSDDPPVNFVRPAADLLFQSACELPGVTALAVILTGMGKDGTDGARALRANKGFIIAESSETAVVFGMPRSAMEAGAVDQMLPLDLIAENLVRIFSKGKRP